ncbi:MAG: sensor histidine kinase, partial [Actinomycetota bacterium]
NVFNDTASKLEQLIDSQRAFIADASHQLRTPLAALRLRLENLEAEMAPLAQEDLEGAIGEVRRLSTLVDALLALARAERELPSPQPVNVVEVARDRLAAWEAFADERAVRLQLKADDEGPLVNSTPGHLEQVLDNLIANAIEISSTGGRVHIGVVARNDHVELRVSDEGPGMGPEERARAFDRFWRSPEARSGRDGTGLGLAIVKQLLSNDGADISLQEAPTGGLSVVIKLRPAGVAPKRVEVG